jgi:uncharacterized repeat protein (TIGR01451 family)
MKKITLLMMLMLASISGIYAQAVTATVTTTPCNGNGVATVNYTGFTPPVIVNYDYYYLPDVIHSTMSATTDDLVGYTGNGVKITVSDNSGNLATTNLYNSMTPYISVSNSSATCNTQGQLICTVYQTSTNNLTFNWINQATNSIVWTDSSFWAGASNITDTAYLPAGQYYVQIQNAQGCVSYSDSAGGLITGTTCFQAHTTINQPACTNGSITIDSITNAVAPYTYLWSNGSIGSSISGLTQGVYWLKVFDANGDSIMNYYTLTQNPQLILNTTQTPASCTNGSISVTNITNAVAPIAYMWSNGSIASNITGLSTGNYHVDVVDANGCMGSKNFYVNQVPVLTIHTVPTPATCLQNNGASTAFSAGGTAPYTYLWNNGTIGNVLNTVTGGTYTVHVTDANGCIGTGFGTVPVSSPINVNYTTTLSSCTAPTGSATLNVWAGTAPYTISWGTFPVQTGVTASALSPGYYPFHITDAVGCVKNGSTQVFDLSANMNVNFGKTQYICGVVNGAYAATVTGGTSPFSYSWSTGATTTGISNLQPGYYSLNVTDANSCVKHAYDIMDYMTNMNITVTKANATCVFNSDGWATATPSGGTSPYTYSWSGSASTSATANALAAGSYYVYVTDANGCQKNKWVPLSYNTANNSCYCTLQGYAYVDANSNCTMDAGELGIPNSLIYNTVGGYDFTDINGFYSIKVPSGASVLSQIPNPNYPIKSCQSNAIPIVSVASSGCIILNNIADSILPKVDMHTYLIPITPPRPGFYNNEKLVTVNLGTNLETLVSSVHADDGQLGTPTFANGFYGGSSNHYNNTTAFSMLPTSAVWDYIEYYTPTNTPLGTLIDLRDTVCNTVPISGWINDETPWNNVDMSIRTVVGSWDPNHKAVSPEGNGPEGNILATDSVLTYTVQFQNEGSYYAQNVVVLDSLDANLDWSTMKPIFASHPVEISMSTNGVLKYNFQNIILPTKTDEPILSNGHFIYSIKPKKNWMPGTSIQNSAAIYFDFNEPVITNKVKNTLTVPASTITINKYNGLSVYPNPANDVLNIAMDNKTGNTQIFVFDIMGKLVMQQNAIASNNTKLNISNLAPGQYILKVNNQGNSYRAKFSKN